MNALKEIQQILSYSNLKVIDVKCVYDPNDSLQFITKLEDLDFEYNPFCIIMFGGSIYCLDQNKQPVWLTREDPEHEWKINRIPPIYGKVSCNV